MKSKTIFICQNCGFQSPKWLGRCSSCGQWNTMIEEVEEEVSAEYSFPPSEPVLYGEIKELKKPRIMTKIEEFNQVLGGGIVLGSLVLIGGEPGIGKSTLLLQVSKDFSSQGEKVLYVSGEESLEQVKIRGERLGLRDEKLYLLAETNLERIIAQAEKLNPRVLVIDSVQTVFSAKLTSTPGTISQVREVANQIFRFAKRNQVASFLIGHITKEGSLAGPKSLEHMVDVVLYFEGERDHAHRILRALKNRFGPVSEVAIFEMESQGLQAVSNPSAFFLKERPTDQAGSVVVCTIKGTRPLLAEIQALVSSTLFVGNPRRMTVGLDHFRTAMLLAVLERKLGYSFAGEDIYLNVAGGLTINEPATDLGVAIAVISCLKGKAMPSKMTIFGEVGLSGEVRSVSQPLARLKEAHSLGFETIIMPQGNLSVIEKKERQNMNLIGVQNLKQAINHIF
ncbi:DNA repair protein RadA [candidate division WOR-1 bacterium DG_54_3]|uniref:DNA repair protein RadA n=1 Tax=candidate division WOR-1 bacterium DG_54_3 TaxID=1703775 RepID=A0A0S7Y6B9_UNCSA|nr:MAG: DNA repair protein RadA [candidate division WOR-1 bacterium DG_54_3]